MVEAKDLRLLEGEAIRIHASLLERPHPIALAIVSDYRYHLIHLSLY